MVIYGCMLSTYVYIIMISCLIMAWLVIDTFVAGGPVVDIFMCGIYTNEIHVFAAWSFMEGIPDLSTF